MTTATAPTAPTSHTELQPEKKPVDTARIILLIEDDLDQQLVLIHRLESQGFQAISAGSASQGMELARSARPDLVLLDVNLPDLDGFNVCEMLADDSDLCGVPVILLSGAERPDAVRRARQSGSQFFVRKPYDPNALLVLIENALRETDSWDIS